MRSNCHVYRKNSALAKKWIEQQRNVSVDSIHLFFKSVWGRQVFSFSLPFVQNDFFCLFLDVIDQAELKTAIFEQPFCFIRSRVISEYVRISFQHVAARFILPQLLVPVSLLDLFDKLFVGRLRLFPRIQPVENFCHDRDYDQYSD